MRLRKQVGMRQPAFSSLFVVKELMLEDMWGRSAARTLRSGDEGSGGGGQRWLCSQLPWACMKSGRGWSGEDLRWKAEPCTLMCFSGSAAVEEMKGILCPSISTGVSFPRPFPQLPKPPNFSKPGMFDGVSSLLVQGMKGFGCVKYHSVSASPLLMATEVCALLNTLLSPGLSTSACWSSS